MRLGDESWRTEWSAAAQAVWGKSCRADEDTWLPVVQHLMDSADVAGYLWDNWLPTGVKRAIERALPVGAQDGLVLFMFLAGTHDVAKISPAFVTAAPHLLDRLREHGFELTGSLAERSRAPHAAVGRIVFASWFESRYGANRRVAITYADVVGSHHGKPVTASRLNEMRDLPHLVGTGRWHDVREEVLDTMAKATGADRYLPTWAQSPLPLHASLLLTGAVILADWLASDQDRFCYRSDVDPTANRAAEAWANLDLPVPWRAEMPKDVDELMARRFPQLAGATARPIQRECFAAAVISEEPTLLVVEAPMGGGKTEGALMAAEVLAAHSGAGGVFFGLPTMATSDAMFRRVRRWIDTLGGRQSTYLAHGKAQLNEDFAGLVRHAHVETWDEEDPNRVSAVVDAWLFGRKKGALANFVVGTIDQALFAALYAKHVMLRHLALAGKVVVIDEVHAADEYMRMYLVRTLEWLAAYSVSVVLLSATLPSAQRAELVAGYRAGLRGETPPTEVGPVAYPAITRVTASTYEIRPVEVASPSETVSIGIWDDDLDGMVDRIEDLMMDGGCVAIIRNTVQRAQETATRLRARLGDIEVVLIHARFLAVARAGIEDDLRRRLGPDGGERPVRLIVVGTQVLEQSLDIDFDLMVSDLAPIDLLLQRIGRLHRHHRDTRPALMSRPQVFVTGITDWDADGVPVFDGGSAAVYHAARLYRAAGVLHLEPSSPTSIVLPDQIRPLVEAAYDPVVEVPEAWRDAMTAADTDLANKVEAAKGRAAVFLVKPVPENNFDSQVGFFEASADVSEERTVGGTVRDGDDGIEVIVVRRNGRELRSMPGDYPHADTLLPEFLEPPESKVAMAVAACTVRLPGSMSRPWKVDRVLDDLEAMGIDGWQSSYWLAGQLILILDDNLSATVADFQLQYDASLGLVVTRAEADQ